MRITTILLLIILTMSACASPQPAPPVINPLPTPVTVATLLPLDTATTAPSGTAVPPCTCPAGTTTPAGASGAPTLICNCPNKPVPPTISGPQADSTPQALPAAGVTMADNGKNFLLHPGASFLLNLGTDTFNWTVTIDDQNVLAMQRGVMVIRGAQGIYQAGNTGQAVLTAIGKPICQPGQMCMTLAILFKITVIVQ
jgi:hypothetical protein